MKKIFLTLLTLCFVASYGYCSTVNSYDSYGRKTGSYRTNGSTTTSYDKYGRKTGTINKHLPVTRRMIIRVEKQVP